MNLLIDNNAGLGQQDYTSYLDTGHLPQIARRLNYPATLTATLVASDGNFDPPVSGARIVLQRCDGIALFTGYLATAPEQQYLGYGQLPRGAIFCRRSTIPACSITMRCPRARLSPGAPPAMGCKPSPTMCCPVVSTCPECKTSAPSTSSSSSPRRLGPSTLRN